MEAVFWFFILGGFAAFAFLVRAQYFASYGEAWTDVKRSTVGIVDRFVARHDAAVREKEVGIEVPLSRSEALDRAVEFMTRSGHALESRTGNSLTFVRRQKPSAQTGIVLLLFFVLPGILYLLLGGKTVRATIAAFPNDGGSRTVIGGDDAKAVARLTDWARGLKAT